jgi:tricorn protease
MKNVLPVIALILSLSAPALAEQARLMSQPDISGNGSIAFTYEDDLWLLPAGAAKAHRLTSHPGRESQVRFSPDGASIAFMAAYDGNTDIYILPTEGGSPRRLTWSSKWIRLVDWSRDGRYIYFISPIRKEYELWRIPSSGGAPERIPVGRVWEAAIAPDDRGIVCTPNSADRMNWRGYRGGLQPDLFLTDMTCSSYTRLTDWAGYDCKPVFAGDKLFFVSDRQFDRMNLYMMDVKSRAVSPVTMFTDWDVESVGASDNTVVFTNEAYLYKYDLASAKTVRVAVELESDHWATRPFYGSPDALVNDVVPGNGGTLSVVESRGELFLFRKGQPEPVNLTHTAESREILPELSPDGKQLAFYSDATGEYELYVMPLQEGAKWTQITKGARTYYYHVVWSPDNKRLLFEDKDYNYYWADVATKKVTRFDKGTHQRDNEIYWEFSDYDWSADGKWIAYAKCELNMNSTIHLCNTETGKTLRVTDDRFDNLSPAFDRNGRYLYFISYRNFEPELDPFMDNNFVPNPSRIMALQLQAGEPAPFTAEGEYTGGAEPGKGVDVDGISSRVFTVPIDPGNYYKLMARNSRIFFLSKRAWGFPGDEVYMPKTVMPYTLETVEIDGLQRSTIADEISISYHIAPDGSCAGVLSHKGKGIAALPKGEPSAVRPLAWGGVKILIQPRAEFEQIFRDVCLQVQNFFYDPQYQGLNWDAVTAKYKTLLPFIATRQDLNGVLAPMLGELGVSHMYVWRPGEGPRVKYDRTSVAQLGADLVPAGKLYRFDHIIDTPNDDPDTRNPLRAPDVKLKEGDYLIAIDGQEVNTSDDYRKHLVGKGGKSIELTVNSSPSGAGAWTVTTEGLPSDDALRYTEMVEHNYRTVREATGGKIGYMHISDMDKDGLMQFERAWRAERFRDGLIIDVRDNGGGFVSWFVVDKLERIITGLTKTRGFDPMFYPHGAARGPMVLLCNEGSGSDGDLITWQFKERKFGPVIGTRTWGGLIGIVNFLDLIDGGMVTQVNVGFSDLKGHWIVENHGVDPDIEVVNSPMDREKGVDAQLNKAIDVIQQLVKERPPVDGSGMPAFPKKF